MSNTKKIIIAVIAIVVIVSIYFYSKNKKAAEAARLSEIARLAAIPKKRVMTPLPAHLVNISAPANTTLEV